MTKWQAFYQKLVQLDVPKAGFICFLIHSFIVGWTVASAIAIFAICALYAFTTFLDEKRKDRKQLELAQEIINKVQSIESTVNVIKLGQGFRGTSEEKKKLF